MIELAPFAVGIASVRMLCSTLCSRLTRKTPPTSGATPHQTLNGHIPEEADTPGYGMWCIVDINPAPTRPGMTPKLKCKGSGTPITKFATQDQNSLTRCAPRRLAMV
jgi:hypothetical protein